jgi:DNA-binding LytR/AlgR family response regulator
MVDFPAPSRVLTCVIVDDEPLATAVLGRYCAQLSFLQVVATFHDSLAALAFLQTTAVDVVLLDIDMPGLSGVQLAQILPARAGTRLLFTTAHDHYALQGYELGVTDYLLKPIAFPRFVQALTRVQQALATETSSPAADAMFVKHEHRLQRVAFETLLYVEGCKEYLRLHLADGSKLLTLQSFRRVEEVLPPHRFARIHRSYLVALNRIEHVERSKVQLAGHLLPLGEAYREAFLALLRTSHQL